MHSMTVPVGLLHALRASIQVIRGVEPVVER